MKKPIILSERPRHACNIANKLKKLDIRRSAPENWVKYLRGETKTKPEPIEVYVYCCLSKTQSDKLKRNRNGWFLTDLGTIFVNEQPMKTTTGKSSPNSP